MKIYNKIFIPIENGVICSFNTDQGIFSGESHIHPEDRDKASISFGKDIAELRAYKKYFKSIIKELKKEKRTLSICYDEMSQIKNFNPKSPEAIFMRKSIEVKQNKINEYQGKVDKTEPLIKDLDERRQAIVFYIHEKIESKEKGKK